MSDIFISHASADNAAAERLRTWLSEHKLGSMFLDFDAEAGIPAGEDWEQELYRKLRACKAVVVLCSPASMSSRWCFAEIVHARALGKAVFPLLIEACQVDPVLSGRQVVDVTGSWEAGLQRLSRGLAVAGVASGTVQWDPTRAPYPGLMAFDEQDAPIFFGREEEIGSALEVLAQARRYGADGLVVLLGASGSGKSSLMRAGLLPRLRADPGQWQVTDPFRPGDRPFAALAGVLARTAQGDYQAMLDALSGPGGAAHVMELVHAQRAATAHGEATLVVALDQFEELLGHPADHPSTAFLKFLHRLVTHGDGSVLVLATMRSDFLADLQRHPAAEGLAFRGLPVGALAAEGLVQVIEEPARVAGLALEDGLTQALLADVEGEGTLPLLAFALRELWERRSGSDTLRIADYREGLGGLRGAIAHAAEGLLDSLHPTERGIGALRRAFLVMVRVDESGHYARRPVARDDLPEAVHGMLDRFVTARLLAARGDGEGRWLEVAHEALFHAWRRLAGWLEEDREFLLWRQRLRAAVRAWRETGQDEGALLRGAALAEAQRWHETRREDLSTDEAGLIDASLAAQARAVAAERERQQRELEQARVLAEEQRQRADEQAHATRRLRRFSAALGIVLIAAVSAAVVAWQARQLAVTRTEEAERATARAEFETSRAEGARVSALSGIPDRATAALVAGITLVHADLSAEKRLAPEAVRGLGDAMRAVGYAVPDDPVLRGHNGDVLSVAYSPDGTRLLSNGEDHTVRLWDVDGRIELVSHPQPSVFEFPGVTASAFAPDGKFVVVAVKNRLALVLDASTGATVASLAGHEDDVMFAAFSRDGTQILTTGTRGKVLLWNAATHAIEKTFEDRGAVLFADLSPDGKRLTSGGQHQSLIVWNVADQRVEFSNRSEGIAGNDLDLGDWVKTGGFSRNGRRIVAANIRGSGIVWDVSEKRAVRSGRGMGRIDRSSFAGALVAMGDEVVDVTATPPDLRVKLPRSGGNSADFSTLSPDGKYVIAAVTADPVARVFETAHGNRVATLEGHAAGAKGAVLSAAFRPRGRAQVATASRDGTVRIWNLLLNPALPDVPEDPEAIDRKAVQRLLRRACNMLRNRPVYSEVRDACSGSAG